MGIRAREKGEEVAGEGAREGMNRGYEPPASRSLQREARNTSKVPTSLELSRGKARRFGILGDFRQLASLQAFPGTTVPVRELQAFRIATCRKGDLLFIGALGSASPRRTPFVLFFFFFFSRHR